jgi:hypothetical protein
MTTLETALTYFKRGFSIIPLQQGAKTPAIPTWKEFQSRKPTEAEVEGWFGDVERWLENEQNSD